MAVARLVSDVLSRNRDNPDFEISVQTCSVTYMYPPICYIFLLAAHQSISYRHRQHFRSDILVTFHAPFIFTPKARTQLEKSFISFLIHVTGHQDNPELLDPVDFTHIRALTTKIQDRISSGTFNSPSWDLIRTARMAARMYAPLGTSMTLGDHVRLTCTFIDAFKNLQESTSPQGKELEVLEKDLKVSSPSSQF